MTFVRVNPIGDGRVVVEYTEDARRMLRCVFFRSMEERLHKLRLVNREWERML